MKKGISAGLLLVALALGASGPAPAQQDVVVLDAETLEIGGEVFRLHGIDAPEEGQRCWLKSHLFDCGMVARTALLDLVTGSAVTCRRVTGASTAGTDAKPARCFAAGYDLSEGMTYTGWALADRRTGERYARFEAGAREAKRGLWRGDFVMPWDWRSGSRLPQEGGNAAQPAQ